MRHSASSNNLPETAATSDFSPTRGGSGGSSSGTASRSGSVSRSGSGSRSGSANNSFAFLRLGSIGPGSGSEVSIGSGPSSSGNRYDTPQRHNDGFAGPGPPSCTRAGVSWTDGNAGVQNVLASKDRGLAAQISQDPDRRPPGASTLQPYRRCITPDRELQTCAFSAAPAPRPPAARPVPRDDADNSSGESGGGGGGGSGGGIAREGLKQDGAKQERAKSPKRKRRKKKKKSDKGKAAGNDVARQDTTQTVAGHPALRPPAPPESTPAQ